MRRVPDERDPLAGMNARATRSPEWKCAARARFALISPNQPEAPLELDMKFRHR